MTMDNLLRVDADVTSEDDCRRVIDATLKHFGTVDVLVNNAAIAHDPFPKFRQSDFNDVDASLWRRVVDVNVTGPFLMTRAVVGHLVQKGWGRIINISTAYAAMLGPGVLPYGPTKAALESMTVGWAKHLAGTGVTVNDIQPGGPAGHLEHPKHWRPKGLVPWPAEIMVPPLRWLVSEESDGVTGQRFVGRLWESHVPGAEAAAIAGFPAGWAIPEAEASVGPAN